jgi:hypothetical protein
MKLGNLAEWITGGGKPTAPTTTNLCTAGTATTVSGTGPWTWACNGSNGGANASCSAPVGSTPVAATVTSVNLSNTTVSANAGAVVGAVSVTTNPPGGTYSGVITLGGANASSFALTNGVGHSAQWGSTWRELGDDST